MRKWLVRHRASALWLGPAGCVTPEGVSATAAERLTGIALRELAGVVGPNAVTLRADHPLTQGLSLPLSPVGVGDTNAVWQPVLAAADPRPGEALGLLEAFDEPGFVCRDYGERLDVWSAMPLLPAALMRNLYARAGVAERVSGAASVYGAGPLYTVRSAQEQPLGVRTECPLLDILSGKTFLPEAGYVMLPLRMGETTILLEQR